MAFDVYPSTLDNPLNLASGAGSGPMAITERIGPGTGDVAFFSDVMYIRVAMLNPALPCGPPPLSGDLTLSLSVDGGLPVVLTEWPIPQSIFNLGNATHIADAAYVTESNGVTLIYVIFQDTGAVHNWQLEIQNNNPADPREFTWVVADNIAETGRPWMDISATTSPAGELNYDTLIGAQILVGQTENHTLQIANRGTGPLTVSDVPGVIGASDYEIVSVPPGPVLPNSCGDMVIAFNAPLTPGESNEVFSVGSDDPLALDDPLSFHNRQVTLMATAGRLEVMFLLDTSGSMSWEPGGNTPPAAPNESRWGRLKDAAKAGLILLGDHAEGAGRFGVSMFPDITQPDFPANAAPPISSEDFYPPADISAVNVGDAGDSLDAHTPADNKGATPMGHGIERVIGAAGSGNFEGGADAAQFNRRWMILMTDGAHNSGPPDPSEFYRDDEGDAACMDPGTAPDGRSFADKGVRVVTVAYGDDTGTQVDHALLNTLACKSDGVPLDAGVDDQDPIDPLAKQMLAAVVQGLNLTIAADPTGHLTQNAREKRAGIEITPYDSKVTFVVDWNTFDETFVNVQLLTPLCELITPDTAIKDPDMAYHAHPRFKIYTIGENYLRNTAVHDKPRHGTWTLIIAAPRVDGRQAEPYRYEVFMASRLKLKLDFDKSVHYAGDPISLTAAVTLDGKPVAGAGAMLHVTVPGKSADNWLAGMHVTKAEFARAAERFVDGDITTIAVKSIALAQKGLVFDNFKHETTIPMIEDSETGCYRAEFGNTSVTGAYEFYVTVTGKTAESVDFHREIQRQARVAVRPDPGFTIFDITYTLLDEGPRASFMADIRVWPRDRFDNVVMADTEINPLVEITARGGEFDGPLVNNMDGSYSRRLRYSPRNRPLIGLNVAGMEIVRRHETAPFNDLVWSDRVLEFKAGLEGQKGINRYTNPEKALGDATVAKTGAFVSLGAFGSLTVGLKDRIIEARGKDDVIVFVRPGEQLRPYAVEALISDDRIQKGKWVPLGSSRGSTRSFGLKEAGIKAASAIRIVDRSGRTLDRRFKPSPTPGVGIMGVGFGRSAPKSGHWLGAMGINSVDGIGNKYVETLKFEGIETIAQLAAMEPASLKGTLPMLLLIELKTKAVLALRAAKAVADLGVLKKRKVLEILSTPRDKLAAAAAVPEERLDSLYEQLSTLQLSLDNAFLRELTMGDLAGRG